MCRNIKTLFNFEPPATDEEVRAASLQFVRKLSGYTHPSKSNEAVFAKAIEATFRVARDLIDSLETDAPARDREIEAHKARERNAKRFGTPMPKPLAKPHAKKPAKKAARRAHAH